MGSELLPIGQPDFQRRLREAIRKKWGVSGAPQLQSLLEGHIHSAAEAVESVMMDIITAKNPNKVPVNMIRNRLPGWKHACPHCNAGSIESHHRYCYGC